MGKLQELYFVIDQRRLFISWRLNDFILDVRKSFTKFTLFLPTESLQ